MFKYRKDILVNGFIVESYVLGCYLNYVIYFCCYFVFIKDFFYERLIFFEGLFLGERVVCVDVSV